MAKVGKEDRSLGGIGNILSYPNAGSELDKAKKRTIHFNLEHLHGPEKVDYGLEELVVACVVRNGKPIVRSFVEHYFSLGAKHLVFLDNGSSDGTIEVLEGYNNVTVLRSFLPHTEYHFAFKQYLLERFGRNRWSLCVDVDELFDWPYSDVVGLDSLLMYLNEHSYTAVVAQMLDMFPEHSLSESPDSNTNDEPLKDLHRFYDISNVEWHNYCPPERNMACDNVVSNQNIRFLRGGIKKTIFGYRPLLLKHPLLFLDDRIRPFDGSAHWVSGACVADFSGVLHHYSFLPHLYERVRRDVREKNYFNERKFERLASVLGADLTLQIKRESARELRHVNELVDNGFLVVSAEYLRWADYQERENGVVPRESRLVAALESAEAKMRDERRRLRFLRKQVNELLFELANERTRAETLEKRNLLLDERMQAVNRSRGWRLLAALRRVKARARRIRKNSSPSSEQVENK